MLPSRFPLWKSGFQDGWQDGEVSFELLVSYHFIFVLKTVSGNTFCSYLNFVTIYPNVRVVSNVG